jgi:hypothetical protein
LKIRKPRFERIARGAGGIFCGLVVYFPVHICDDVQELEGTEEEHYELLALEIGLILWRLCLEFTWRQRREARWLDWEQQ